MYIYMIVCTYYKIQLGRGTHRLHKTFKHVYMCSYVYVQKEDIYLSMLLCMKNSLKTFLNEVYMCVYMILDIVGTMHA